jgi:hypothetical protein
MGKKRFNMTFLHTIIRAAMMMAASLCMVWTTHAYAFFTVHKIRQLEMNITFQAGLGNTDTDTVKRDDILNELSAGRPGKHDALAAVVDCNNPYLITVVVWDMDTQDVAAGSSTIPMYVINYVAETSGNKEKTIALLDAQALFGTGYITAKVKFKESRGKHIPPDADPGDETFCISSLDGLSIAGYIDTDQGFGIVWGGRFAFRRPMTSLTTFDYTGN